MIKRILKFFVSVAILAAAFAGFNFLKSSKPPVQPKQAKKVVYPVSSLHTRLQTWQPVQQLYGSLNVDKIQTLSAPAAGEMARISVQAGETISAGMVLFEMDQADFDITVATAKAQLASSTAQYKQNEAQLEHTRNQLKQQKAVLNVRKRQYERMKKLSQREVTSVEQFENVELSYLQQRLTVRNLEDSLITNKLQIEQSIAQIAANKASLNNALLLKKRSIYTADQEMLVVEVVAHERANLNRGSAIVRVLPLKDFEVTAALVHSQIKPILAALDAQKTIQAQLHYFDRKIRSRLSNIQGLGTGGALFGVFKIDENAAENLRAMRPNVSMPISLQLPKIGDALGVPFSALYGRERVFTIEEGRLKSVPVEYLGVVEVSRKGGSELWALVRPLQAVGEQLEILTTHLPIASNGVGVNVVNAY